jgi:hypothetical protein
VHQVRIYRLVSGAREEVWNIALTQPDRCVGVFTFPETPAGYEVVIAHDASTTLRAESSFEVEVHGAGFDAFTRFTKR